VTRVFTYDEECDRNRIANLIGEMPSPRGSTWSWYIKHRLRMMENGIASYTTNKYARLQLDKHIEWHRAIDTIANKLVCEKSALVWLGGGTFAANSPISIKKHVRCPGLRKLLGAFKKRSNVIVRIVDEYMTSQLCGRCFKRYPRWTNSKRYKMCTECQPDKRLRLPTSIVTNVSKRVQQMERAIMQVWQEMAEAGDQIAAILTQRNTGRLVSKKQRLLKTWQPNANVNAETEEAVQPETVLKTVWHRDISATRLIMYKGDYMRFNFLSIQLKIQIGNKLISFIGHCTLFGMPIHPLLRRPTRRNGVPNANNAAPWF